MSSSILHQCPSCGHVSDISLSLAAFIENPYCNQCGMSASESNGKLQDELAALFDRQMTMAQPSTQKEPISYSISQHYHHSTHVAPPNPNPVSVATHDIQLPANPTEDLEMNDQVDTIAEDHGGLAEPYMISGYEAPPKEPTTGVPYASSTDPVYKGPQWWEPAQVTSMESQYGVFQEMMNRYHATHGVVQRQ